MILNTEPIKRLMVLSSTTSARLWRKRSKRLSTPNLRLLAEQSARPQSVEAGDQDLPCKTPQYSPEVFKKVMEHVENFEENN